MTASNAELPAADIRARPLPEPLAAWLRKAMNHITAPGTRAELVSIAEAAYMGGYTDAYDRGYRDGATEADMAYRVKAMQRPLPEPRDPATTLLPPPPAPGTHHQE